MSPALPEPGPGREEVSWRSLAAPGLDEDDLFAAAHGLPGAGALWGDGLPVVVAPGDPDRPWDEATERRRRHDRLLRKWPESP